MVLEVLMQFGKRQGLLLAIGQNSYFVAYMREIILVLEKVCSQNEQRYKYAIFYGPLS